jgi:hypothetical protein
VDPLPRVPHSLAPGSQTVSYLPWLKVSVGLRYVRTFPWAPEAWPRALSLTLAALCPTRRIRATGFAAPPVLEAVTWLGTITQARYGRGRA